jgi:UDP-glucose 4-epimerase
MKIAVTGITGFVGQHLCQFLHSHGDQVRGLVRHGSTASSDSFTTCPIHAFTDVDELTAAVTGCDYVIHLIARTHQTREADTPAIRALYTATNVDISRAVARAAARAGVKRLVFLSSIKTLGETTSTPLDLLSPADPQDMYGQTKLEAEDQIRQLCNAEGIEWVILRPPLIYAANARGNLHTLRRAIRYRIPLPLAAIHNRRSIISIQRLCHYLRASCTEPAACGQRIPVADPHPLSSAALAQKVGAEIGIKPLLLPVPVTLLVRIGALLGKSAAIQRLTGNLEVNPDCAAAIFRNHFPDA